MDIRSFYEQTRKKIANENFSELSARGMEKPDSFNWVRDIFEPLNVQKNPNGEALIWKSESGDRRFTFKELQEYCNRLLNFLRSRDVAKSSIIYTQLPLVPANWISYLAAIKGGYIVIPAATTLSDQDISYRFERSMPNVIIADKENAAKIDGALRNSPQKVDVKLITGQDKEDWINFDKAMEGEETAAKAADTNPDDPLFYFFTSGTTGMPKVVVHTHFSYPIGHLTTASWIGLRAGDIHYNISQPGWAKFAWSSFFAPWAMGATVFAYHSASFDAAEQLKAMQQYGITTFCAPPTALRMLIQEDLADYDYSLRQCVAAGEPLGPDIIDSWKEGTGILIRDGYGQTEATCMVANMPDTDVKFGSMGKPTFLYDIIIADEEGHKVPATETGNICLDLSEGMSAGLFKSYGQEEGDEDKVFKNGLYYTGDKAYRDEDGYIWFVGRDDDVIKASDYRIGPFEVESVLSNHPAVVEAAVVASPHDLRGNVVKAFIVLSDGTSPSRELAKELFRFSEERLAVYKIPRIIEFMDEFPKTVSGKIRRVELRSKETIQRHEGAPAEHEFFHEKY
jgi:acetyl-CoA synthetase